MAIVLIFSMLDSDGRLYEPSPKRHFLYKNMKYAYLSSPFQSVLSAVNDRSLS